MNKNAWCGTEINARCCNSVVKQINIGSKIWNELQYRGH